MLTLMARKSRNCDAPPKQVSIIVDYDPSEKKTQHMELPLTANHVMCIDNLISMKRKSGRVRYLEDALALENLR